jgi:hypothetical protein
MTIQQTYQSLQKKHIQNYIIIFCLGFSILITLGLDYMYSKFQGSSFYISESLLFGSYWLLFFPLLRLQLKLIQQAKKLWINLLIVCLTSSLHLLIYPILVWFISKAFYYHTFAFLQTLHYGLTEYLLNSVIIYSSTAFLVIVYKNKPQYKKALERNFISSIIVSDINNKKVVIEINDILYFSANSPYINIHHKTKTFLYTETLKSLENQLDNNQFIRIHKSFIINIDQVASYQSKGNGDYNLILKDDVSLRMSRNYVPRFKSLFEKRHRLTTK